MIEAAQRVSTRTGPVLLVLGLIVGCGSSGDDDAERATTGQVDAEPVAGRADGVETVAEVETEDVVYAELGGWTVAGYLARPTRGGEPLPAILVVPEAWGITEDIRATSRELARRGYVVLAADLFRGRVAADLETARDLAAETREREAELVENLRQAVGFLREKVGAPRVGIIGWRFGGTGALRMALVLPGEIDAVVVYNGRPVTDRPQLERLRSPILCIFGAKEAGVSIEELQVFDEALTDLGKDARVLVYEDYLRFFGHPSQPRTDSATLQDAWQETLDFLEENLEP